MILIIFLYLLNLVVTISPLPYLHQGYLFKTIGVDVCVRRDIEKVSLAFQQIPSHSTHLQTSATRVSPPRSAESVSIAAVVLDPDRFHMRTISVRGTVTQLELHVDDTGLFINFVFVLQDGTDTLVVFGKHDQTLGGLPIMTDESVEVTGIFWEDRIENDYHFKNNLEALTVIPYPPLDHEET